MKIILTVILLLVFQVGKAQDVSGIVVTDSLDYTFVDELPAFAGGDSGFAEYIRKNFVFSKYIRDERLAAATFRTNFTINKEGKLIEDSVVAYDPMTGVIKLIIATRNGHRGTAFQNHLLEILEESPDWTPGKYNGEAIPVRMIMHIYVNSGANTGTKEVKINNLSSTAFKKKKNDFYYNKAVNLSEEGNFSESIENFTLALQYNPGDIDALYNRGIVKYKTKDETGACEDWNKIKSLGKSDADELLNRYCESKEDEHKK